MSNKNNEMQIDNVGVEFWDGGALAATFTVNYNGQCENLLEWINLDNGFLCENSDAAFNNNDDGGLKSFDVSSDDEEYDGEAYEDFKSEVIGAVNDYLRENPISMDVLQRARDVRDGYDGEKTSEDDQEEVEFDVEIDGVTYSISSSNETAYVGGQEVVWLHFEDDERRRGELHVWAKDVEYYGYEKAVTDRIRDLYHSSAPAYA
ncbi:hypothetical protein F9K94_21850 [Brucella tritici]|uniref:Uncharacterized protein n=1 Tax=Brucella tritici TaxID=94626 RepID=A0A7V7VRC2_9HYPH|nr:hypothetical protein [Brucella tritici]KAB2655199.1 hypothetical protein F9K94_21850 [Brucella tritici]